MKALVIAPQPFFSPRGTPLSVYHRTALTAELGVKVDLLTYGQGRDVEIPGVHMIRIPDFWFLGNVKVGPSLLKIFLDVFLILWMVTLLITRRYDFVHAHEESIFFCLFLKPIFRFKLIYDMHSSLPQQLTNFKFTSSKILIGLFEKLENQSLKTSEAVITICPELEGYAKEYVKDQDRLFLIENSILDEVKFKDGRPKDDGNKELHPLPMDRPIIFYGGTFEFYQGLDILIPAIGKVLEKGSELFLLMVGGNSEQVKLYENLANECGIKEHCLFTGQVSQPVARAYMRKTTVITSPRSEGTNTPLKVYEQLASGIPLVATRILSHTQVLNDEVCVLVDPNPESMADGITRVITDKALQKRLTESARKLYDAKYSRTVYKNKMSDLLEIVN